MSYKIQYSPETANLYPQITSRKQFRVKRWMTVVITVAAVFWVYLYGFPDWLIPGDPEVTKAAASTMVGEMKNGTSFGDAVTTFCKMIIDGAEITY